MGITRLLFVAALLYVEVSAYLKLLYPEPFNNITLNNLPLALDGSDFPCKLRPDAFEAPTEQTFMRIGETNSLKLEGSSTHGGGSCQISLTSDARPSKNSKWSVIKSFEGGCPVNVDSNLQGGSESIHPFNLNFIIPEDITPGKYTLAWTWFNQIGNREMYMNCTPIIAIGAATKGQTKSGLKRASIFLPMFVANINGCITKENVDIRFPHPRIYIEYKGNPGDLTSPADTACIGTPLFGDSTESVLPQYSTSLYAQSVIASSSPQPTSHLAGEYY